MSIATELTRIQQAKADIKSAIEAKGVTIPSSATIDTYDDYVAQISGGGSYDGIVKSISVNDFTGTTFNKVYTYITEVTIPSGVTSIGNQAFQGCRGLINMIIPNSVTSIGVGAFIGCASLTSINIPSGVTSIGSQAFNSCSSLTTITVEAETPPTLGSGAFDNTNNCPIYVPFASLQAYQTAWPAYYDRLLGGSSVTTGGDNGGGHGGFGDNDPDDPLIDD